jgi:hypothetical protein
MQMYDVVDEPRNHDGDSSDKFVFRFFSAVGIAWVIALLLVIGLEHTRNTMADDHRAQFPNRHHWRRLATFPRTLRVTRKARLSRTTCRRFN